MPAKGIKEAIIMGIASADSDSKVVDSIASELRDLMAHQVMLISRNPALSESRQEEYYEILHILFLRLFKDIPAYKGETK